ncbi:MAG: hypothetical protein H7282_16760 [Cytophagaceae bacterium]|nr:hypothetical protein [Cytophagaceae bacterium]
MNTSMFFFGEILTKIIPLVSLMLSLFMAYIAYKVYQSYSQRQFLNKQIEVVTNLLEVLNTYHFELNFYKFQGKSRTAEINSVNIFEIFHVNSFLRKNQSEYENNPVYLLATNNQVLEVKKFIDNPFTPKKIADCLINFYSTSYQSVDHAELGNSVISYAVVIESSVHQPRTIGWNVKEEHRFIHGDAIGLKTWSSFLSCTEKLRKEFEVWFSKNGIEDLNIRTDFKQSNWTPNKKSEAL